MSERTADIRSTPPTNRTRGRVNGKRLPGTKVCIRKIALLLHPDLAGALTKQELELWYQAQRAYAEKDVVLLETILARCDRVGTNSSDSV